ncbi:hypothetical protein EXIGLDRAFT_758916 [Exidia glandulosa HHB12029]|uniref:C2H2-type domain-containing protein n=1 Tax=Exidia glandulosa HHB12029 TaxID=1314781 RepID=A0A165QGA5_EXIGL|nr:hypothetical protein EXIGLDRAFT_758916 [Exidia glandulosa HHB12029]
MPRISNDAPAYWKCSDCKTEFGRPQELKRHVRDSHVKPMQYGCPQCDYTTVNKSNVNRHQQTRHHGIVLRPWEMPAVQPSPPAHPYAPLWASDPRRYYPY